MDVINHDEPHDHDITMSDTELEFLSRLSPIIWDQNQEASANRDLCIPQDEIDFLSRLSPMIFEESVVVTAEEEAITEEELNYLAGLPPIIWSQDGGVPTCPNLTEVLDIDNLFKLVKQGEKLRKNFNSTEYLYSVEMARLPCLFSPETSVRLMPVLLGKVIDLMLESFGPDDRVCIGLESQALDPGIYLSMRTVSSVSVETLMQKIELLNSQNKLCIDNSFNIRVWRTVLPSGGNNRRIHRHVEMDRRRFAKSIVTVSVRENLCLPAALILGEYRLTHNISKGIYTDSSEWRALTHQERPQKLENLARNVVEKCGLTVGRAFGLDDIVTFQQIVFQNFQIKVVSANHGNHVIARIPENKSADMLEIYILHDNNHFDLITRITGFHINSYYCQNCDKPFSNRDKHNCGGICRLCYRYREDCPKTEPIQCSDCRRIFRNKECFEIHVVIRANGKRYCDDFFICEGCDRFVSLKNRKETDAEHVCGEMYCKTCEKFVRQADHKCYVQVLEKEAIPEGDPPHIYFDYETFLTSDNEHVPNMVVAQYADGREVRFPKDNESMSNPVKTAQDFGNWLFSEQHKGMTMLAHNFRSYDGHFVLKHALDNNLKGLKVIKRGTKLMDLSYKCLSMKARDTLNFVAQRLSSFPMSVGLAGITQKGEFPHKANRPQNWDQIIPFPEPNMYGLDGKSHEEKTKFLEWYATERLTNGGSFNFRKEMTKYCSNDVTVHRKCSLKFREEFIKSTGIDPFQSVTIAAACQKYYRTFVLKPDEIAVISAHGYQANRRSSIEAAQWLEWENMSSPNPIIYGRNGREHRIGRYFVDGIDTISRTIYEYNGCVFHGHPICTDEDDHVPYSNLTMKEVFEEYETRVAYFERLSYIVETKWSCEWLKERQDPDIAQFLLNMNLREPINPQAAFKGGRTNASRLYYEVAPGEKILHYDIVSLYPSVNKNEVYPLRHPTIIVNGFKHPKEYFGLVYCKVLPPEQCLFPVLPATVNKKLVFTLCRTCAEAQLQAYCIHSDSERCIEGVWVTPELHHAIDMGYRVIEMYEVWHWAEKRAGLFAEYINKFLKEKMEASGWPADCVAEDDRQRFLQSVSDREGITLDPSKIESNPGRKSIAKLMLNSFWGKFGQRDNLSKTKFMTEPKEYFDLCRSQAVEIHDVFASSPLCLMVTTTDKDEYNEGNSAVNVAIAAFTTSYARLKLLDMMEKLGERLLYYDTDSVIFIQRPGDWLPETGNILGDWDNQLEPGESHIIRFVSCGPKVYSYETDTGRLELKVKGLTQNGYTENILNFDEVTKSLYGTGKKLDFEQLQRLMNGTEANLQVIYPEFFRRNGKTQKIDTIQLSKQLKLVYDKRVLFSDFTTVPYGTKLAS